MRLARLIAIAGSLLVLLAAVRPAAAQDSGWYRYQGAAESYDGKGNEQVNCGPATVAMAIQYATGARVPIKQIRAFVGNDRHYASYSNLASALSHWGMAYQGGMYNARSVEGALGRGHIVVVVLDMRKIGNGADVNGASADPSERTGRFETVATLHWIVVKDLTPDGRYFVVDDPDVWSGPGNRTYWYADGTPKGLDRLYAVSQVDAAMATFGAYSSKGLEILSHALAVPTSSYAASRGLAAPTQPLPPPPVGELALGMDPRLSLWLPLHGDGLALTGPAADDSAFAYQPMAGSHPSTYGLVLGGPGRNEMPDSDLEATATRWQGLNGYVAVEPTQLARLAGARSLVVTKLKPGLVATFRSVDGLLPGQTYAFSAYMKLSSGEMVADDLLRGWVWTKGGDPAAIDFSQLGDRNRPPVAWVPDEGGWYRGQFTFTAATSSALVGLVSTDALPVGSRYYVDDVQLERGARAGRYVTGPMATTPTFDVAAGKEGTLMLDATALAQPRDVRLARVGSLDLRVRGSRLVLLASHRTITSTPWQVGSRHAYAVTWGRGAAKLYVDARLAGSAPFTGDVGAGVTLGDRTSQRYAVVGDLGLWRNVLPASDLRRLSRPGPTDFTTGATREEHVPVALVARSADGAPLTVEWSVDGRTWHPWGTTATSGRWWEFGATPGVKTAWVRLTDDHGSVKVLHDSITLAP